MPDGIMWYGESSTVRAEPAPSDLARNRDDNLNNIGFSIEALSQESLSANSDDASYPSILHKDESQWLPGADLLLAQAVFASTPSLVPSQFDMYISTPTEAHNDQDTTFGSEDLACTVHNLHPEADDTIIVEETNLFFDQYGSVSTGLAAYKQDGPNPGGSQLTYATTPGPGVQLDYNFELDPCFSPLDSPPELIDDRSSPESVANSVTPPALSPLRFQCNFANCGRVFDKSNDWKRHVAIHTPEGPRFICDCGYANHRKDNYKRHVMRCQRDEFHGCYKCKCGRMHQKKGIHIDHIVSCRDSYFGAAGRPAGSTSRR